MPELPEVETIVRDLRPRVEGNYFKKIELLWHNTLLYPSQEDFNESVENRQIVSLDRRGKYLIFHLDERDHNQMLVMHLRMTGSFLWQTESQLPRHTRTVITFNDGGVLCFIDPRKFGKIMLGSSCPEIEKLGVEPFDSSFTVNYLKNILADKKMPIKTLLLDQTQIAGIGNMYADETLFAAHIHPERKADSLSLSEIETLHKSIIEVLQAGIAAGGASVSDYFRPNGERGHAHEAYKVAHNKGGNCPVCGNPVQRIIVGQRGTYYCAVCQK